MTFLICTDIWQLYCSELDAHDMPLRETAESYLKKISDSAAQELERRQELGEGWQRDNWEFDPQDYDPYHWVYWVNPPFSADVVIPYVNNVLKLGYDPSCLATHHFREVYKTLRSLPRPDDVEPRSTLSSTFDIPVLDVHGNPAPDVDFRKADPRDAFEKPPRNTNDPSP